MRATVDQLVISREQSLQAEDRLRIANLSQRMLQLELASAEEATRMKSQFLANMSHEIRTPKNAVIGLSQMVLQSDLDPRQRDCIEKFESAGQHLMGIIDDILVFSKVEAGLGQILVSFAPVDAPASDIRGRGVLVADDNNVARTVIMGLHVSGVSSGYGAIAAVERAVEAGKPVEVVFVDCRMPELDGLKTVRRIQSLALAQPPAAVMMTAYGRDEMALELREANAPQVLFKPVGPSVLFTTTAKALGFRHAVVPPPRRAVEPKLTGASGRVLLVEDNELNQMVASMMLANATTGSAAWTLA